MNAKMHANPQSINNDIPSGPRAINVKNILLSFSIFLASCAWSVLYFRHWSKTTIKFRNIYVRCDLESNRERGMKYFLKVQMICLCKTCIHGIHTSDKNYIPSKINDSAEILVIAKFIDGRSRIFLN